MANVKTVSFGANNLDLQNQQMQVQRRQQMIDMLRQQSAAPLQQQQVSGQVVPISPWEGVAKLGQAYFANQAQEKNDARQSEIYSSLAQRKAEALRSLAPAGVFDGGGTGEGGQGQADPAMRARWAQALSAYDQDPELGGKLIQELSKTPEFSTTPQYDQSGNAFVLNNRGEPKMLEGVRARDKLENVNGVWQNPYEQGNNTFAPQDPNQPFGLGPNGVVPNQAYQNYQISRARAGASNVSVNTATKPFLAEIGKGAGEAVNTAYQGALAATKTLQNVDQIRQGLGKAILGPGANARVTLAQLGQTLGVTGKDTTEQLENTRMVMQGLARQELAASEQMRGQGQITESEREILRKAESGRISDMTTPEVNTLLSAIDKTARYRIGAHQENMQRLRKDPNAQGVVDYMQVDAPAPSPSQNVGIRRYNPATGRIE